MKYTQKVIDMIVNKYKIGDCPDIDWAIYQEGNDPEKVFTITNNTGESLTADQVFEAAGITKETTWNDLAYQKDISLVNAKIKGVPSSKEFKKLQKDNAKLAKRINDLEIDVNHLKLKNAMR